jgi:hypothetical protein
LAPPVKAMVRVPGFGGGLRRVVPYDTVSGRVLPSQIVAARNGALTFEPPAVAGSLALAIGPPP